MPAGLKGASITGNQITVYYAEAPNDTERIAEFNPTPETDEYGLGFTNGLQSVLDSWTETLTSGPPVLQGSELANRASSRIAEVIADFSRRGYGQAGSVKSASNKKKSDSQVGYEQAAFEKEISPKPQAIEPLPESQTATSDNASAQNVQP